VSDEHARIAIASDNPIEDGDLVDHANHATAVAGAGRTNGDIEIQGAPPF
jgi:hypothetical protein